ncbi:MAG: hypothetical protein AAFR61_18690 [Bacteroidota bacterium]
MEPFTTADLLILIQEQVLGIIATLFGTGLKWGFIGGLISIAGLIIIGRKKGFKRPHWLWSWIVKINFVYLPVLCFFLGFSLGIIGGTKQVTQGFIHESASFLIPYGKSFLGEFATPLPVIPGVDPNSQSLEEMIASLTLHQSGLEAGSLELELLTLIHESICEQVLAEMDFPPAMQSSVEVYHFLSQQQFSENMLTAVPVLLEEKVGLFFQAKYWFIWLFYLPFFLIPVGEFALYHLILRSRINPALPVQAAKTHGRSA